jgi:hypothetical protein
MVLFTRFASSSTRVSIEPVFRNGDGHCEAIRRLVDREATGFELGSNIFIL